MSERLRVLLVLGTSGGGVGRHVASLAESLAAQGHSVIVAGPQSTEDLLGFSRVGATFAPVPIAERPSVTGDPRSIRTIRRLARNADILHAHGLRAGALSALARGKSGPPPLVVTLHNALVSTGPVAAAYAGLERIVAHRADLVLGVSADLQEKQRSLGARRVGPAVVAAPTPRPLRGTVEQTRRELDLADDALLVVSVARLTEQKGLPLLLDAASLVRAEGGAGGRARFVIAGDGPARTVLQQRIDAERLPVTLLGWRDDIPELFAAPPPRGRRRVGGGPPNLHQGRPPPGPPPGPGTGGGGPGRRWGWRALPSGGGGARARAGAAPPRGRGPPPARGGGAGGGRGRRLLGAPRRRGPPPPPHTPPRRPRPTNGKEVGGDQAHLRHRGRRLLARQGADRLEPRAPRCGRAAFG